MLSQQEMKAIWKDYVLTGYTDPAQVRPAILESWERCKGKVDPFQKTCPVILTPAELDKRRAANSELLEIARPVMNNLYRFVAGSGFVVALADAQGYLLEIIGDPEALELVGRANFVAGADWSEEVMGTNAVGTALALGQPIQIYAYEHWSICVHVGICSGAPIRDPDTGEIIGVLDMTGSFEKVHSHTLGMVVAAVGSIEGQMAARRNWQRTALADQYKTLIMESMSDGLVAIDNAGVITHINRKAMQFLALDKDPVGQNIYTVLKRHFGRQENYRDLLRVIESREKIADEFLDLHTPAGLFRCMVTTRRIWENESIIGEIIILQDICRVNRLVGRVVGGQARTTFADLIGKEKKFLESIELAVHAAKTSSNVLLLGESGTGKDLFAQAIHNSSSRRHGPFIAVNCAAIPRDLLGSELFGYVDGAFTGAKKGGNPGKFELANGGTLFLDEIGDMPLEMQTSLLRVIEDTAVTRIGSGEAIPVDVRIITATNKDLSQEVARGNFRSDLYYRLNVISIELPPLRERKADLPLLVEYLARKIAMSSGAEITGIAPGFIEACQAYDWPGNVRELRNVIERAVSLARDNTLTARHLPPFLAQLGAGNNGKPAALARKSESLKIASLDAESQVIITCLEKCKGNRSLAAKQLGIARSTLYRKMRELGL